MEEEKYKSKLLKLQRLLKENFDEHVKNEFNLLLSNYNDIKNILSERDNIIDNEQELGTFWTRCIIASGKLEDMEKTIIDTMGSITPLIKSMKVAYEPDYWCSVELNLNRNDFTNENVLRRRFNVVDGESQIEKFTWKNKEINSELFNFFEEGETDLEMFDILYDVYVNAVEYFYEL